MTPKLLRLAYLSEFFVAVVAIFTAWSEIGGQATLDVMPWAWKCGLGIGLSAASVCYTAALVSHDSIWDKRVSKWLALLIVLLLGMGAVTYFYAMQASTIDGGDEQQDNTTSFHSQLRRMPEPVSLTGKRS